MCEGGETRSLPDVVFAGGLTIYCMTHLAKLDQHIHASAQTYKK